MLTVAVLGPVEVHLDGERVAVPTGKSTEVLLRLALDAGRLVRAERIIEDLWADAAGTGKNTLQSKVSQLRRAMGAPGLITSGNGGYALAVEPDGVDALRVAGLAARAADLRRSGDAGASVEVATEALALFRGEVLVDAGDGAWLQAHRVHLEEVRLGLVEDRLDGRVELGAGGELIGELEGWVERYPLREGLWASLITALYRTGRQADALAAYTRVRSLLVTELGIEPGPALARLEDQILQQSPALASSATDGRAERDHVTADVLTAPATATGNLPSLSSPLIGRIDELDRLARLVSDQRLVTIVGPAGVGKTRVAVEAARRVETVGGSWIVRLDGADAITSIPQMVAETLLLTGGEPMLVERLRSAETLVLLDNCEHVIDAVAELAGRLLDAAPQLRILATSQLPLGLDGEVVLPLAPLPIEDGVALFVGRAAEVRAPFVLDDDTTAMVTEVCRSLDGLPLAIELAAARVKSLSVGEIARRLDDRFALVQDPTSRRPERRRALAGAIAWSYDLLFPDDQRGLWALACFAGGAPLAAAEHVLGALDVPAASAVDVVGRLVDRSLVSVEITDDDDAVRYRLLDSIRAFALDRLREADLDEAAAAAHAAWFAAEADRAAITVRGAEQPHWVAFVRAERANIDAALAWTAHHDPSRGLRIANGFGWAWVVLGDGVAGAERVRGALDGAPLADLEDQLAALLLCGWLEASAGDLERADGELARASDLAVQLDDVRLRADVERHQAFLRIQQGRFGDAAAVAATSAEVYRSLDRPWELGGSRLLAAFAALVQGDTAEATAAADEAVALLQPIGDSWALVHAEAVLGAIAGAEHRFDDAARSLTRAAEESERLGFVGQAAYHLTTLGRVQQQGGDLATATATLERAMAAATSSGDLRMAATARTTLARVLRATDQIDAARALLEHNDRWYRRSGGGDGALLTRSLLAAMVPSDDAAGEVLLTAVLEDARAAPDLAVQVLVLDALARRAAEQGDPVDARRLLDSADALLPTVIAVLDDEDRLDARRARRLLGEDPQPLGDQPTSST